MMKKRKAKMQICKCVECGHIFDEIESVSYEESRGEFWGSPCSETVSGCPLCKGDYEFVTECEICGSFACADGEDYCEDCKTKTLKKFQAIIEENFTQEERDLLNEFGVEL